MTNPRPPHERPTAQELASGGEQPIQIAGKSADACPYCGAAMFANGTQRGESPSISFQYVVCRCCKKSFRAKREVKSQILYEVNGDDESSSSGKAPLTLVRHSA